MARLGAEARSLLDKDLLDILACPACRAGVVLVAASSGENGDRIVCTACGRRYPVRDGIPIMLVEEAESASDAQGRDAEPSQGQR